MPDDRSAKGGPGRRAVRVAAIYAGVALLWALFLRQVMLGALSQAPEHRHHELAIELLFSAATAGLLFWLVRREMQSGASASAAMRRAEEELKESETRFRAVVEGSEFPVFVSLGMQFAYLNPACVRLFGATSADELIGREVLSRIHPDFHASVQERAAKVFQGVGGSALPQEEVYLRMDGSHVAVEASASPLVYKGQPGAVVFVQDITRRREAQDRLLASEAFKASLLNSVRSHLVVLDADGVIVAVNEPWRRFAEENPAPDGPITRRVDVGANYLDVCKQSRGANAEGAMEAYEGIRGVLSGRLMSFSMEYPCDAPDQKRWFSMVVSPLSGVGRNVVIAHTDITERKRAEAAVARLAEQRQLALDAARMGWWHYDPVSGMSNWDNRYAEIFGVGGQERRNEEVLRLIHPDDLPRVWAEVEAALNPADPKPYATEYRVNRADGSMCWVEARGLALFAGEGAGRRAIGFAGTVCDITERKREEEDRLRHAAVIEQSAEAIVVTDTQGRITYVNPAFERITGYSQAEVIGKNPSILKSGRHDEALYRALWETLGRGEVWRGHFINRRKDGSLFEEDATITPVRGSGGRPVSYVAIKRDVTEQVQMWHQLIHAQKMETIGQLAGGVAHDFNNLMQAILGYSEILLNKMPVTDPRHGDLLGIQKAGRRAADLTRQLLALARKQNLEERITDVNALVEDLNKMLHRVLGKDIRIEFDLAPGLERVLVDQGQIGQALLNLAVNARDAMPRGGRLTFKTGGRTFTAEELAAQPGLKPGRFVFISVTDTGSGIPPEIIDKIFEPFFTTKGVGKGTGLGLATTYGIARQHRGWIHVVSEVGRGACFTINLPAMESAEPDPGIRSAQESPDVSVGNLHGNGRRILLIEDENVIRKMCESQLTRHGYLVTAVSDAASAQREFERCDGRFDLILTDVVLPDTNGLELLSDLVARKPGLRVLINSGYTDNDKRWPLIRQRQWPFIAKPYTIRELLVTLRDIFAAP